jgi:hypothetical protein
MTSTIVTYRLVDVVVWNITMEYTLWNNIYVVMHAKVMRILKVLKSLDGLSLKSTAERKSIETGIFSLL